MPGIPQHTAQGITAVNDGVGRQIHRDAIFLSVTSPNQDAILRLPSGASDSWEGQTISGYVGANGFTLTGATSINGETTYQVPPNYYFSVLKGIGSLWIIEIVDNLGTGGGVPAFALTKADGSPLLKADNLSYLLKGAV